MIDKNELRLTVSTDRSHLPSCRCVIAYSVKYECFTMCEQIINTQAEV